MAKKKLPKTEIIQDLIMTAEELFRIRAYMAEADLAQLRVQLAGAQKKEFVKSVDPQGKIAGFDKQMTDMSNESAAKRQEYKTALGRVAERLGIDPTRMAWDDENGLVRLLEDVI